MNFYIKEWPDSTATLMTESGRVIWIFPDAQEAEEAAENFSPDSLLHPQTKQAVDVAVAGEIERAVGADGHAHGPRPALAIR